MALPQNHLLDALTILQEKVTSEIEGMKPIPLDDKPPDNISAYPFPAVWVSNPGFSANPLGHITGNHRIVIEVHLSKADHPRNAFKNLRHVEQLAVLLFGTEEGNTIFGTAQSITAQGQTPTMQGELNFLEFAGVRTIAISYQFNMTQEFSFNP